MHVSFPGRIAGASLKHRGGGGLPHRARQPFPGRIAGASLKRGHLSAGRHRPARAFPGRIAGASLKLRLGARPGRTRQAFPRQNRRGLIEAPPRSRRSAGGEG